MTLDIPSIPCSQGDAGISSLPKLT